MNKCKRCVIISLICLFSFPTQAMPFGQFMLKCGKAFGIGLGYVIASPVFLLEELFTHKYSMAEDDDPQEHPRTTLQEGSSTPLVIENSMPNNSSGAAIILTVNNNNQQASAQPVAPARVTNTEEGLLSYVSQKTGQSLSWLKHHKIKAMLLTTSSCFLGLQAYLWYLARHLTDELRWSSWKKHCTSEELYAAPTKDLLKDLALDAQKSFSEHNPLKNFERLLKELADECTLLKRYQQLANLMILKKFLFVSQELLESIDERINRIMFLKGLVTCWLSEQHEQLMTQLA